VTENIEERQGYRRETGNIEGEDREYRRETGNIEGSQGI
jgi:hypothetical protein